MFRYAEHCFFFYFYLSLLKSPTTSAISTTSTCLWMSPQFVKPLMPLLPPACHFPLMLIFNDLFHKLSWGAALSSKHHHSSWTLCIQFAFRTSRLSPHAISWLLIKKWVVLKNWLYSVSLPTFFIASEETELKITFWRACFRSLLMLCERISVF